MKRLIKKAEGTFTYEAISPLKGRISSMHSDYSEENLSGSDLSSYDSEIAAAATDDSENLAEWIDERYPGIKSKVTNISMSAKMIGSELKGIATVKANAELTSEDIEELKDYLIGQYADGWGEGFEQRPVTEWKEQIEYEEYDEEEGGHYTDYVDEKVGLYVSFWNNKNFNIEVKKA